MLTGDKTLCFTALRLDQLCLTLISFVLLSYKNAITCYQQCGRVHLNISKFLPLFSSITYTINSRMSGDVKEKLELSVERITNYYCKFGVHFA